MAQDLSATLPVRLSRVHMLLFYATCGFPITLIQMNMFLVPLRARELDTPLEMIGIIVGAASLLGMALAVPAGSLADRIGARRSFLIAALCNVVISACLTVTDSYWVILFLQLLRGIPHSMAWVASQTYATSIGRPDERSTITARFSFATNISGLVGPLVIGLVAQFLGFRYGFAFLAIHALLNFFVWLVLPDVASGRRATGEAGGGAGAGYGVALKLLTIRAAQIAITLTFLRLWISAGWQAFFPLYLTEQGYAPALIGLVISASGIVSAVTTLWAGWVARRTTNELGTAAALGIGAAGVALSPYLLFVPLVFMPSGLIGIGMGMSMPLVLNILSDEVPRERRGVAMGMRTTANQGGALVAPVAVGFIVGAAGVATGFLFAALFCWAGLGWCVWRHLTDPDRKRKADQPA